MESIILSIIYLITLPIIIIYIIWKISQEEKYLDYIKDVDWTDVEKKRKKMYSILRETNRYALIFLISLLLILPLWSYSSSVILDRNMHKERIHVPGAAYPPLLDPVSQELGPTYDVDGALEEMEENPRVWLPDEVNRHLDMDDLTKIPGRLAIYRFTGDRYLITYTYLAPYPIIETYGFNTREIEEHYISSLNRTEYEGYLEGGPVHEDLVGALENEEVEIDDNTVLSEDPEQEDKWWIKKNERKEYSIEIEGDRLDINEGGYITLQPPEHNTLIYPNFALRPNDLI
ncbi:MAG: hypothetical protein R6W73_02610 [Candidatus Saliniplasma sp.]